jgi:hypothetical protein
LKKISGLLIIIISINFISCWTFREYLINNKYPSESDYDEYDYFYIYVKNLNMKEKRDNPFFELDIRTKLENTKLSFKNINIEEIIIKANNITYNMKRNIYMIEFREDHESSFSFSIQKTTDLKKFYRTGLISVPVIDKRAINYCTFYGRNPGIKYEKISDLTLSLKIKIELENGETKEIEREYNGKRNFRQYSVFEVFSM